MTDKGTVTVRMGRTANHPISVKVDGVELRDRLRIFAIGMPEVRRDGRTVLQLEICVDEFEFETSNLFEIVSCKKNEFRPGTIVRLRSVPRADGP